MKLEQLRRFCLDLPGVSEDIKWEHDLCFLVGEKMFCVTSFDTDASVSLKVDPEDFEKLCEQDGIIPAPYLARAKWICITKKNAVSPAQWKQLIKRSHELIASGLTKKKRQELGID